MTCKLNNIDGHCQVIQLLYKQILKVFSCELSLFTSIANHVVRLEILNPMIFFMKFNILIYYSSFWSFGAFAQNVLALDITSLLDVCCERLENTRELSNLSIFYKLCMI